MGDSQFIARVSKDGKRTESIFEHLTSTAKQSYEFCKDKRWAGIAYAAGLLHDIGKYSDKFQQRIRGVNVRVDHSTAGAKTAVEKFGNIGKMLAYAIAGHHAGLADGKSIAKNKLTF